MDRHPPPEERWPVPDDDEGPPAPGCEWPPAEAWDVFADIDPAPEPDRDDFNTP